MNSKNTTLSAQELNSQTARISELESRLEFQDETIQKLNDEMVQLQNKLFAHEKQLTPKRTAASSDGQRRRR